METFNYQDFKVGDIVTYEQYTPQQPDFIKAVGKVSGIATFFQPPIAYLQVHITEVVCGNLQVGEVVEIMHLQVVMLSKLSPTGSQQKQTQRPRITLSNGKRVANFSSPHPFTFTDGSVLPPVTESEANLLKVNFIETVVNDMGDMLLDFTLSKDVKKEMEYWQEQYKLGLIDVVFCPLPMIQAIALSGYQVEVTPFRTVRMKDRIKKLVSIDNQGIYTTQTTDQYMLNKATYTRQIK